MTSDDTAAEFVICRMFDSSTGVTFDVPMARQQAEAFGESLRAYARQPDAVFNLACPICDRTLVSFVMYPNDLTESGTYSRPLDSHTLDHFNDLSGRCPDHFKPGSISELIDG